MDLIYLDQDRVQWPAHANAVMKLWLLKEEEFFDQLNYYQLLREATWS